MKKTLAVVSASVLGLAGALGASAGAANAIPSAPPIGPCSDATKHVVNPDVDPTTDNWYMTCVPQYGMGKAEFSITAPEGGFPEGYSLTDGHQTVVSSTPTSTQVQSYFDAFYHDFRDTTPTYTGAFMNLTHDESADTATTQTYETVGDLGSIGTTLPMTVAFPITSVGKATSGFPAACTADGETYQGEYVVTYAPVTTTFSELVGAKVLKTTITLTSPTLYLGLNFDTEGGSYGFDRTKALCASSSAGTVVATDDGDTSTSATLAKGSKLTAAVSAEMSARMQAADIPTGGSAWFLIAQDIATGDTIDLTTMVPTVSQAGSGLPVATGAFAITATPALAETGVDAVPAGVLGGGLLLTGIGAVLFRRRRVSTSTR